MKAKFNQETRDFIEGVFKTQNYSKERQIQYLEICERQKYNYYLDKSNGNWNWSQDDEDRFQSEWDEIIEMLRERREA